MATFSVEFPAGSSSGPPPVETTSPVFLESRDRRVDVAHAELHARGTEVLDAPRHGASRHVFEVEEIEVEARRRHRLQRDAVLPPRQAQRGEHVGIFTEPADRRARR